VTTAANQFGYWSTGNFCGGSFRGPAQQAALSIDRNSGFGGYGYEFYAPNDVNSWGRGGWNKWAWNASCLRTDGITLYEPTEIIINGHFTSGTSIWTASGGQGIQSQDGRIRVISDGASGAAIQSQTGVLTAGSQYRLRAQMTPHESDRARIHFFHGGLSFFVYYADTIGGAVDQTFTADGANIQINLEAASITNWASNGEYAEFDDVSLQQTATVYNVSILATVTPAPSLTRAVAKPVLVTSTPSPSLIRQTGKPVQTSSTPAPSLSRQTGKPVRTTSTPVPSLSRQPGKLVLAASTPVPALSRSAGKLVLTASTPVPSLLKSSAKALRTATTPSPSLIRSTGKVLRTNSTPAPTLLVSRQYARSLLGSTTPVPSLQKSTGKLVLTATTLAPSLTRSIGKVLLASSIPVPLLSRSIGKTLRASTVPVPALAKQRIYHLTIQAIAGGSGAMGSVRVAAAFFR
jgi:hypothetical protein